MAELEIVDIEITAPLPSEGAVDSIYRIEGIATVAEKVGAPPWVYAETKRKEWWKPEALEETTYERGLPLPISGKFTIDLKPDKLGDYEVTIVATPAPLALPVVGIPPITGKSDMMKIRIVEKPAGEYAELKITSYEKITA